ncbi:Egg protein [Schistosoma japonicum]|nr:Egg protein [Schistosoma japonicum]
MRIIILEIISSVLLLINLLQTKSQGEIERYETAKVNSNPTVNVKLTITFKYSVAISVNRRNLNKKLRKQYRTFHISRVLCVESFASYRLIVAKEHIETIRSLAEFNIIRLNMKQFPRPTTESRSSTQKPLISTSSLSLSQSLL